MQSSLIRVRTRTYEELVKLGETILDDFDDIISRLIKEHKERQKTAPAARLTRAWKTYKLGNEAQSCTNRIVH
jgi:hypothetical protein